jgi:hypothetical protein
MNPESVTRVTPVTPALPPTAANMSLRDWFAGMAMQGTIIWKGKFHPADAYEAADAMMEERGKTK